MTNQAEKPCLTYCVCPCHGATNSQHGCPACNPTMCPNAPAPKPAEYLCKLEAERDAFYQEYRQKCDAETKTLTVERDALAAQVKRLESENALLNLVIAEIGRETFLSEDRIAIHRERALDFIDRARRKESEARRG